MWATITGAINNAIDFAWNFLTSFNIDGVYIFGFFVILFLMGVALRFFIMPLISGVKGGGSDRVKSRKSHREDEG